MIPLASCLARASQPYPAWAAPQDGTWQVFGSIPGGGDILVDQVLDTTPRSYPNTYSITDDITLTTWMMKLDTRSATTAYNSMLYPDVSIRMNIGYDWEMKDSICRLTETAKSIFVHFYCIFLGAPHILYREHSMYSYMSITIHTQVLTS